MLKGNHCTNSSSDWMKPEFRDTANSVIKAEKDEIDLMGLWILFSEYWLGFNFSLFFNLLYNDILKYIIVNT